MANKLWLTSLNIFGPNTKVNRSTTPELRNEMLQISISLLEEGVFH